MPNKATTTIEIKTELERKLYDYYTEEKAARKKLEGLVNSLREEIVEFQQKLKTIEEQKNAPNIQPNQPSQASSAPMQYETDEEDLAKETEWVRQKSRKKRKLNQSLSPPQQLESATNREEIPKVKKVPSPPPIIIENVKNYQDFYDHLSKNIDKESYVGKMMNKDSAKINANNEDSYRAITKLLLQSNSLWHSYENKQDRSIRVMAKNLPASCLPDRIKEDLLSKGYKIQDAVNKLSWKTKQPLNMFMLSFEKGEDVNKIYSIKSILGCKVDIQQLKVSKLIPQCKRCQAYGHTQKYCLGVLNALVNI